MPAEILALIDKPHLLMAVLAVGGLLGIAAERLSNRSRRKAWSAWNRGRAGNVFRIGGAVKGPFRASDPSPVAVQPDAADQLRIVMSAAFASRPLLNRSEFRVFQELERMVVERNPDWQVMAQVSLGEILRSDDREAFRCINSKRVDLLLVDGACQPLHAIEYQGGAHYQGHAAARDAVKKEALRRAGIGYHEVVAGHTTPSDLERLVERLMNRALIG